MHESPFDEMRVRDAALDQTLEDSFPASDPLSSIPNPYSFRKDEIEGRAVPAIQHYTPAYSASDSPPRRFFKRAAGFDRVAIGLLRFGLVVMLVIGGLKIRQS
jgi:hypothetical protein